MALATRSVLSAPARWFMSRWWTPSALASTTAYLKPQQMKTIPVAPVQLLPYGMTNFTELKAKFRTPRGLNLISPQPNEKTRALIDTVDAILNRMNRACRRAGVRFAIFAYPTVRRDGFGSDRWLPEMTERAGIPFLGVPLWFGRTGSLVMLPLALLGVARRVGISARIASTVIPVLILFAYALTTLRYGFMLLKDPKQLQKDETIRDPWS